MQSKDCSKRLGQIWQTIVNYSKVALTNKGSIPLTDLYEKLLVLESDVGEENYIFVQMHTLQCFTKEINQLYNIDLEKVKKIFEYIMSDELHHRELLTTIIELNIPEKRDAENALMVKYKTPDRWINYTPRNF